MNLRLIFVLAACLFAGAAYAHTGGPVAGGFAAGLVHPLLGLDHLLAMLAVGIWAAQQGVRARWALPAAFVAAMVVGGYLAWTGSLLPQADSAVALSVMVLGLLVAVRGRWAVAAGAALAAGFGLFHGHVHGLEMPLAASPVLYGLGFVLATLAMHAAGLAVGTLCQRAMRLAGAFIAAVGLGLVLGM